jgi:hypothetical protein
MRSLFLVLLSACFLFTVSCRKGELPEEHYFSKVQVYNLPFPNSPKVDVRFEEEKLGSIATNFSEIFNLSASKGTLKIYKAGTDSLLTDTLLTLTANKQQTFRFAYSEELGLNGFVSGGVTVSPDTISFQVLNNLGDFYKAYASISLHICVYNLETGNFDETGYVIDDFNNVKLFGETFTIPYAGADGNPNIYLGRIKDETTGEFILQPGAGSDFFILPQEYGGASYIFNIQDAAGDITATSIAL